MYFLSQSQLFVSLQFFDPFNIEADICLNKLTALAKFISNFVILLESSKTCKINESFSLTNDLYNVKLQDDEDCCLY